MASIVIMPKQGLMMEEGTITKWLKKEGEFVETGAPLFEMETDKLTITMDAETSGTLLKILHAEGDVVPITQPIAVIGASGEDISALFGSETTAIPAVEAAPAPSSGSLASPTGQRAPGERVFSTPRARLRAEENGLEIASVSGSGPDGLVIERDVNARLAEAPLCTPLAANLAKSRQLELSGITGTGANGKITAADLPASAPAGEAAGEPTPATADPLGQRSRGVRTVPMSGMRKAISRNMLESKAINAQTNHRMAVDMSAAMALRSQYKALGVNLSYNDIIVRACAKALQDFPSVNASVDGSNIVYHNYVNIGTAVSVSSGLIVPVIPDADLIGLTGIAEKSAELIEKARDGKLTEQEYHGGTFTVSSLGMFELDDFVAIINPPESAILAVGKIAKTPVVISNSDGEDTLAIKPMCTLCLSYDHRIIDGAEAAKFLLKLKTYLQTPVLLI